MAKSQDRLLGQLNSTGLQNKDTPLYQVIAELIKRLKELESSTASGTSSGAGSTTVIGATGLMGPPGLSGDDGEDGMIGPSGPKGIDGISNIAGPAGPITIGPMGINGQDGEDGFPIPGNQGIQGPIGNTGPAGPLTIGPMGMDGMDGEDGYPIPGRDGATGVTDLWSGQIIACCGDGNPNIALTTLQAGSLAITPSNIGTTNGRVSYFKLKKAITVANIRWYSPGNTTAIYHIAIYRASDNVRISADNNPSTIVDSWNSIADVFTLAADILYYCVVSADTAGTVAGMSSLGDTLSATSGQIRVLPTGWAGSLDWDNNFITPYAFAIVTVTLGILPNPGNAPVAVSATGTGGMPAIFLDAV